MGKVIQFRQRAALIKRAAKGIELYSRYYETAKQIDKLYIRETILLNLHNNSYKHNDRFYRIAMILNRRDMEELLGYCAAWYLTKGVEECNEYVKKLMEIKGKYGIEVIEIAKTQ